LTEILARVDKVLNHGKLQLVSCKNVTVIKNEMLNKGKELKKLVIR
jgi:hypothetical protein